MAFGYFMNINVPSRQTFTLCYKLAKKVQPQLGLKLDNAQNLARFRTTSKFGGEYLRNG